MAGVFVDRWDRKRTMVVANLLQVLVMLPLLLVCPGEPLWLVYVVAFVMAAVWQFVSPAENALLPGLVGPDRLMVANSLNAFNDNLARIAGPALGGLIILSGLIAPFVGGMHRLCYLAALPPATARWIARSMIVMNPEEFTPAGLFRPGP